ncbi:MAG: hypothetical protein L0Y32_01365 [Nevskiales bacterium]|nr:hypothetical protein [Nevskiales bacterium]
MPATLQFLIFDALCRDLNLDAFGESCNLFPVLINDGLPVIGYSQLQFCGAEPEFRGGVAACCAAIGRIVAFAYAVVTIARNDQLREQKQYGRRCTSPEFHFILLVLDWALTHCNTLCQRENVEG